MDIVTDPTFWGETGLVVASRLAVLAAVLWAARFAVRSTSRRRTPAAAVESERSPQVSAPSGRAVPSARFVDLRSTQKTVRTRAASHENAVPQGDPLRNRLRDYLQEEATERMRP
jgi:hypothetical protein